MNPEPMAWTTRGKDVLRIIAARHYRSSSFEIAQREVKLVDQAVVVGCLDSALELLTVQPAGKNVMSARDWYNGQKDKDSIVFTN
jgi:methionyl-tRNA formyltransferase